MPQRLCGAAGSADCRGQRRQAGGRLQEAFGKPRKIDTTPTKEVYVWFLAQKPDGAPAGFHGCEMEVTVDHDRSTCSAIRCRTSAGRSAAMWSARSAWPNAEVPRDSRSRTAASNPSLQGGFAAALRPEFSSVLGLHSVPCRASRLDRARDQDRPQYAVDLRDRLAAARRIRSPTSWWKSCRSCSAAETARRAKSSVQRMIDPNRDLRRASAEVEISGNVDARRRLADELFEPRQFDAAIEVYEGGLKGVFEHDPTLLLRARAGAVRQERLRRRARIARTADAAQPRLQIRGCAASPRARARGARRARRGRARLCRRPRRAIPARRPGCATRLLLKRRGKTDEARRHLQGSARWREARTRRITAGPRQMAGSRAAGAD